MREPVSKIVQSGYIASVRNILQRRGQKSSTEPAGGKGSLRLASYNVHKCVGTDRRFDPDRIRQVLRELSPDILALQEVDERFGTRSGLLDLTLIEAETGLVPVTMNGLVKSHGWHGNLLLVREGTVERVAMIALPGLEPRGAVLADVNFGPGLSIRIIGAHLGLLRSSRQRQARVLADHMASDDKRPAILMGDLNEWRIDSGSPLARFQPVPTQDTPPSFPARMPLLPLDRIIASRPDTLSPVRTHHSALSRFASDHLPIKATWQP